jgi:DNA-binding NarL/FixJ family response regulator
MSPGTINIVVLHAQATQRETLCDFIADQVGLRVIGATARALEVPDLLRAAPPVHVLVMHHASIGEGASELIGAARAVSPGCGILILTTGDAEAAPSDLALPAAAACLEEERVGAELVGALRTIAMGRRYRPPANA